MILVPIKHLSSQNYQGFSRQRGCIILIFQRNRQRWIGLPKVTQSSTDGFQNKKLSHFSSIRAMTVIKPFFASNPSPSPHQSLQCASLLRGHPPVLFVFVVSFRLQYLLAQEGRLPRTKGQSKCVGWTMLFLGMWARRKHKAQLDIVGWDLIRWGKSVLGSKLTGLAGCFKLDSTGEGDVLLSDREHPVNTKNVGSNREIPVNYPKAIRLLWEGNTANSSVEVPPHQSIQHGNQVWGVGNYCAIGKLWPNCCHRNIAGWIALQLTTASFSE